MSANDKALVVNNSQGIEVWQKSESAAQAFHRAGMLPKGMRAEVACVIFAVGESYGLSLVQSLSALHVIDGKICMSADMMRALCLARPAIVRFDLLENTDKIATWEAERKGSKPVRMSFTWAEAERAGLATKGPWRQYPAAMLRARAASALARTIAPDIVHGLYAPEEMGEPAAQARKDEIVSEAAEILGAEERQSASVNAIKLQLLKMNVIVHNVDTLSRAVRDCLIDGVHFRRHTHVPQMADNQTQYETRRRQDEAETHDWLQIVSRQGKKLFCVKHQDDDGAELTLEEGWEKAFRRIT